MFKSLIARKSWWIFYPAAFAFALDILTKELVLKYLGIFVEGGESVVIIPNFLSFVGRINTGGAFSLMTGHTTLLAVLSVAALAFLLWWVYTLPDQNRLLWASFGLIIGGALGNLVDRIFRKGVVDFIDAHWGRYHWPTFNIADSAICVGLFLVVVLTIIIQPKPETEEVLKPEKQQGES